MKKSPYLWKCNKNGYYYVIFYDGPLGDRKRMESLKTKDLGIAQDRLYLWKQQRAQEEALGTRTVGVSLGYGVKEYLKHFEKRNKPISKRRYQNALDHIVKFCGENLPIASIQVKDLLDYQLHRIAGVEKKTVDYEIDTLRTFLNWCKRTSWVRENVADTGHVERLIKSAEENTEKRVFTDEELQHLLARHEKRYWQLFYIFNMLYYTGLRIGELGHLTVKDVDLRELEIKVRDKTLKVPVWNWKKKVIEVREVHWTPKWYEKRNVPIESRLEPVLREFHERRTDNIFGLYFYSGRGCQISDHISRHIKDLTGREDVSVHTFRHTHISHALNRWGRYPSVVQRWVGHRDLDTTQGYLHVDREDLHREAKKVGQ